MKYTAVYEPQRHVLQSDDARSRTLVSAGKFRCRQHLPVYVKSQTKILAALVYDPYHSYYGAGWHSCRRDAQYLVPEQGKNSLFATMFRPAPEHRCLITTWSNLWQHLITAVCPVPNLKTWHSFTSTSHIRLHDVRLRIRKTLLSFSLLISTHYFKSSLQYHLLQKSRLVVAHRVRAAKQK